MTESDRTAALPLLAVVYEPDSISLMRLIRVAVRRWRTVWIVDTGDAVPAQVTELLAHHGQVMQLALSDLDATVEQLAPLALEGIVAFADQQLQRTAAVAERLDLRFHTPAVARLLTEKSCQRRALADGGVPIPAFVLLDPTQLAELAAGPDGPGVSALTEAMEFPAVLKPESGGGSVDTFPVADPAELCQAVASLASPYRSMIVETYLADDVPREEQVVANYVSVESVVDGAEVRHVAVTGCFPLAEPFRETGSFIPSSLPDPVAEQVRDLAGQAIQALGVTIGVLHTEIKLTPDGPRVIEVNGRIGGDIPELLASANGVDLLSVAGLVALGRGIPDEVEQPCDAIGFIINVQAPAAARRLVRVEGLDAVANLPEVTAVVLNRRPGDRLDWRAGTYGYVCSASGRVVGHDRLLALRNEILNDLSLVWE